MNGLKQNIKNFSKYRFLLFELIKKNIKLKYRRSYLGVLWTLVEPLLTMIVLTIVFGTFFGRGNHQYPVYILSGRLLYSFFSTGTKAALKSVSGNASMIKKVYVPKYMYVLSAMISNFITFAISLIVLLGVGIVLKVQPTIYLLEAIIPLIVLFIITSGLGLILATLDVFFRDIEYIWTVFSMLIMYASAIFYTPDSIISRGNGWVFDMNPLFMCISNFRSVVLYGEQMNMQYLFSSLIIGIVLMIIGVIAFYKKQDDFILYV